MHHSTSRPTRTFLEFTNELATINRRAVEAAARIGGEHRPAGREAGRSAAAGRRASDYLEQSSNAVTETDWYEAKKKGCKSWFCKECCLAKGIKLKSQLKERLRDFKGLMMLTFTIDQQLFAGPQEAFDYVAAKRCIGVTMQRLHRAGHLHSRRYFCVIEWQKNGWPHWHILVDASRIPFGDLCEAWNRNWMGWQERVKLGRPGFGSVRFSVPRFPDADKAAGYVAAYLTKVPDYGFPEWVLDRPQRSIRRYYASKGFWGQARANSEPECKPEAADAIEEDACPVCKAVGPGFSDYCEECGWSVLDEQAVGDVPDGPFVVEPPPRKSIRECMRECGRDCVVLRCREAVNEQTGELVIVREFIHNLEISLAEVLKLCPADQVNERGTRAVYRDRVKVRSLLTVTGAFRGRRVAASGEYADWRG